MPQTWLMADTHLGHRVAARARGFGEDVQAHDATILRNLARKVRDGDDLYLLGDLAFDGWVERMPALAQLPGNLHIILGNHDRPAPNNPRGHHYQRTLMEASRALSVLPYAQINYKVLRDAGYCAPGSATNRPVALVSDCRNSCCNSGSLRVSSIRLCSISLASSSRPSSDKRLTR